MKVYNETKTEILTSYDLTKGYLKEDTLTIHHAAVKERRGQYHYKTIKEYPNGGKDVEEICDIEPIEARDEYYEELNVYVYIPYTERELKQMEIKSRIMELQNLLASWDYKTSKYADGDYTDEEWAEIVAQRKAWREEINILEIELQQLS